LDYHGGVWRLLVGGVAIACAGCGRHGFDERFDGQIAPADGLRDDVSEPNQGYCATVPALGAAPVIDGTLEQGLTLQTMIPVGWQSSVMPLPPVPDVPINFAIAYRPDGLYIFVDVADPSRFPARMQDPAYCGDSIELYVDHDGVFGAAPQFDAVGALQFIARAPDTDTLTRVDGEYYMMTNLVGAWQTGYAVVPRAGGYVFEGFIDAGVMQLADWSLARGNRVGFDLGFNVSRTDGATVPLSECPQNLRLGQFFLRIDETFAEQYGGGAPFWVPTAFCSALID
jgi:hypothetical protein